MEAVKSSELIVGKHYSDIESKHGNTILEFVKNENGSNFFKYVSGAKNYEEENGLIEFSDNFVEDVWHLIN